MSKTMRSQIQAQVSEAASRGKLPPVVGVACARPEGFPTAAACPSDATEAREAPPPGAGLAGLRIPEGGSSLQLPDKGSSSPSSFPEDLPAVEAEWESSNLPPAHRPEVYTCPAIRSACRTLRAVSHAPDSHYLHLTDSELLHLHSALADDRKRTKSAIARGRCKIGDLRATDSIWEKLQSVYFGRIRRPA